MGRAELMVISVGQANITTNSITTADGRNIATEHGIGANKPGAFASTTITIETLLIWNPQVIVAVDAVRNHQVYACPVGVFAWCTASSEWALTPKSLAKALHPSLFPDLDVGSDTNDFYSRFHAYRHSDQQVTEILSGASP